MNSFVINESYVEQLIITQRDAIKYYLIFASVIIVTGIIIIVLGFVLPKDTIVEGIKALFTLGGTLVASLSAFPLKEIITRKEKIGLFSIIKKQLEEKVGNKLADDTEEINRLKEIMWKTIEKTALL